MYRWRAFESICELLVRAVEEGSKRPSKSLKSSKLRRTSNLTFSNYMERQVTRQIRKKLLLQIQNKSE